MSGSPPIEFSARLVGSVAPNTAVAGATNVFATDLVISEVETGILRVLVSENTGVVFSLVLTRGGVTVTSAYNGGAALAANSLYLFDVPVQRGDIVNFQFGGATTVLLLDAYVIKTMGP